jgi:hypothetical protein
VGFFYLNREEKMTYNRCSLEEILKSRCRPEGKLLLRTERFYLLSKVEVLIRLVEILGIAKEDVMALTDCRGGEADCFDCNKACLRSAISPICAENCPLHMIGYASGEFSLEKDRDMHERELGH